MEKVILVFLVFLIGCAETPESYRKAELVCENFGGLEFHYIWPTESWHCLDGSSF